jgi:iron complex transport system substrate-binding protein
VRIVSLLPSATEIVCALGLIDELVGVTDRSDWPPEVASIPVVTRRPPPGSGSGADPPAGTLGAESDGAASADTLAHDAPGPGEIDLAAIAAARPDLVLVRERCDACGWRAPGLVDAIRLAVVDASVISLEPTTVEGILNSVATIGAMTEAEDEAVGLVEMLRERMAEIGERVVTRRDAAARPARTVALSALSPLMGSGHWLPDQVRRAGGWDLLGAAGEGAARTSWAEIRDVDPEVLLVAPAGHTLAAAVGAWEALPRPAFYGDLRAVRAGAVFALDPGLWGRPGPRVIDGIATLAEMLDPGAFADVAVAGSWTPVT